MRYLISVLKKLLVIGALLGCAAPVAGARQVVRLGFRDSVSVNDTVIRLGAIAKIQAPSPQLAVELAEAAAGEAAPPGYSRYVNSADLIMFGLRQQFKGVEFRADTDRRVKVSTAFVPRRVGEFESEIRNYIASRSSWKSGQCTVTIENPGEGWKAYVGAAQVALTGLENPRARGRVCLELTATQFGRETRIPVRCRLAVTAPVVVAAGDIAGHELVGRSSVKLAQTDITDLSAPLCFDLVDAIGKRAVGSITTGTVLTSRMLEAPPLVERGDPITIQTVAGRARVSVGAVARENGRLGEKIWVENSITHKLVRVTVAGPATGTLL